MFTPTPAPTPAQIRPDDTLNAIVERAPRTLAVLQRFGLDTCCGGALALREAAAHHALDLDELLGALRAAEAGQ